MKQKIVLESSLIKTTRNINQKILSLFGGTFFLQFCSYTMYYEEFAGAY